MANITNNEENPKGVNAVIKNIQDQFIEKAPLAFSFYEVIFNAQGLPIDYKLLEYNSAFEKNFNPEKSKIIGKNMSEWLFKSEKTRGKWYNAFADLILTEYSREFDEMLEINGHWYLVSAFVPCSGYLIVLFHDATKFEKAKMKPRGMHDLSEVNKVFSQSIFDYSPLAIIIYQVKGDGASSSDYIIQSVNPASLRIEGWREENVIGKPLGEVRPGVDEFGIINIFQQVWKTGRTAYYPARVYKEGEEHRWFKNTIFKLPTGEIVAVYSDVTEKIEAEKELFAEKEKLRVTLYSIGDGVITTDRRGRIEMINQVTENLTGWKQDEAKGMLLTTVFDIYSEATGKPCENPVDMVLKSGNIVGLANHTVLRAKDGKEKPIVDSAAPIKNQQGEILGVVLVFRDVSEAKEKEAQIKFLSYRDSLTGLYNRTFFEEELKRLDTESQLPLTFIIGDLDGLKLINDVFGHQAGDQALVKMAETISVSCRGSDVISRWGGDEFVVLLPKTPEDIGQKICDRIKKIFCDKEVTGTKLSISLGCSSKTDKSEKWQEILKKAEDNMYKSKLLGAKSYRSTILSSIKNTLFEKSYETEEHGERLGHFCREIGRIMDLPSFNIDELEVLAMLHDIGKIAIDDQILNKPGKLTEAEMLIIKKHPETGCRIAQTVPELSNIADYILAHHERWDGKGYPKGLAGEAIPLLSRILAVADAYDAMTQDRPYRKAVSPAEAKEELRRNAGTQFDPQIVDIFLEYLEGIVP